MDLLIKQRSDWQIVYLGITSDYGDESNNQTITQTPSLAIIQLLIKSLSMWWWGMCGWMLASAYWVNEENNDQLWAPLGVRKAWLIICLDDENHRALIFVF